MLEGLDLPKIAFIAVAAAAVGLTGFAFLASSLGGSRSEAKVREMASHRRGGVPKTQSVLSRLTGGQSDSRRRQVQESLRQVAERERSRRKGVGLRILIQRAGFGFSVQRYWIIAVGTGLALGLLASFLGGSWIVSGLAGIAGFFGIPRWTLTYLAKRRQKKFLEQLADAVDIVVRGLKAGLPLSEAMRLIGSESPPPLGPEFMEVVEGQRVGITIDQGIERMFERMPLPEVSFLGIAISIQSKSGGNLAEALSNLSKVLRERKKLKAKVRTMSSEAKWSAIIIGCVPVAIIGILFVVSPGYMMPLFTSTMGHFVLIGCGLLMLAGSLIMYKMINFDV